MASLVKNVGSGVCAGMKSIVKGTVNVVKDTINKATGSSKPTDEQQLIEDATRALFDCPEAEFQEKYKKLQNEKDQIAVTLKKSVIDNYDTFVDTSKKLALLQSEMQSLSSNITTIGTSIDQILQHQFVNTSNETAIRQEHDDDGKDENKKAQDSAKAEEENEEEENSRKKVKYLFDAPDKLAYLISRKLYSDAVDVVEQCQKALACDTALEMAFESSPVHDSYENSVKLLLDTMINDLLHQMLPSPYTRKVLAQLKRLGKKDLARDVMLQARKNLIASETKKIKFVGDAVLYTSTLIKFIALKIRETCDDFTASFDENDMAGLITWAKEVLVQASTLIKQHVISGDLMATSEALKLADSLVTLLLPAGLGIQYVLWENLTPSLNEAVSILAQSLIGKMKSFVANDTWTPEEYFVPTTLPARLPPKAGWAYDADITEMRTFLSTSAVAMEPLLSNYERQCAHIPSVPPTVFVWWTRRIALKYLKMLSLSMTGALRISGAAVASTTTATKKTAAPVSTTKFSGNEKERLVVVSNAQYLVYSVLYGVSLKLSDSKHTSGMTSLLDFFAEEYDNLLVDFCKREAEKVLNRQARWSESPEYGAEGKKFNDLVPSSRIVLAVVNFNKLLEVAKTYLGGPTERRMRERLCEDSLRIFIEKRWKFSKQASKSTGANAIKQLTLDIFFFIANIDVGQSMTEKSVSGVVNDLLLPVFEKVHVQKEDANKYVEKAKHAADKFKLDREENAGLVASAEETEKQLETVVPATDEEEMAAARATLKPSKASIQLSVSPSTAFHKKEQLLVASHMVSPTFARKARPRHKHFATAKSVIDLLALKSQSGLEAQAVEEAQKQKEGDDTANDDDLFDVPLLPSSTPDENSSIDELKTSTKLDISVTKGARTVKLPRKIDTAELNATSVKAEKPSTQPVRNQRSAELSDKASESSLQTSSTQTQGKRIDNKTAEQKSLATETEPIERIRRQKREESNAASILARIKQKQNMQSTVATTQITTEKLEPKVEGKKQAPEKERPTTDQLNTNVKPVPAPEVQSNQANMNKERLVNSSKPTTEELPKKLDILDEEEEEEEEEEEVKRERRFRERRGQQNENASSILERIKQKNQTTASKASLTVEIESNKQSTEKRDGKKPLETSAKQKQENANAEVSSASGKNEPSKRSATKASAAAAGEITNVKTIPQASQKDSSKQQAESIGAKTQNTSKDSEQLKKIQESDNDEIERDRIRRSRTDRSKEPKNAADLLARLQQRKKENSVKTDNASISVSSSISKSVKETPEKKEQSIKLPTTATTTTTTTTSSSSHPSSSETKTDEIVKKEENKQNIKQKESSNVSECITEEKTKTIEEKKDTSDEPRRVRRTKEKESASELLARLQQKKKAAVATQNDQQKEQSKTTSDTASKKKESLKETSDSKVTSNPVKPKASSDEKSTSRSATKSTIEQPKEGKSLRESNADAQDKESNKMRSSKTTTASGKGKEKESAADLLARLEQKRAKRPTEPKPVSNEREENDETSSDSDDGTVIRHKL